MLPAGIDFTAVQWDGIAAEEHPGETGVARWYVQHYGTLRVRIVEYSPGYLADHWCLRGHVLFVLDGELTTELADGRVVKLSAGMSYTVSDDMMGHRSRTENGARLFIVD